MRVVEIISDTNVGGAGRLLLTRLGGCMEGGFESTVILPRGSALRDDLLKIGAEVREIVGCADRSFSLKGIREILSIIRETEPEIVNCHGCLSGRIAALLGGVPVRIYTRHCAYSVPLILRIPPIKQLVGAVSVILSNGAVAVAEAAAENMADMGYPRRRIRVIINGVDGIRRYSESEREAVRRSFGVEGCFVVGISARLEECKDHQCLLRAARILQREDDRYRFMILGDGSLRERLEKLSDSLGISSRVIFCGFHKDVTPVMNCFDLNLNCSKGTETSSLALSEGMSIGLPSVVSDYGGNPYMVREGENGLLYKTGDFFQLAEKIRLISDSHELYERLSDGAYKRFLSELTTQIMNEKLYNYYKELADLYVKSRKDRLQRRDSF